MPSISPPRQLRLEMGSASAEHCGTCPASRQACRWFDGSREVDAEGFRRLPACVAAEVPTAPPGAARSSAHAVAFEALVSSEAVDHGLRDLEATIKQFSALHGDLRSSLEAQLAELGPALQALRDARSECARAGQSGDYERTRKAAARVNQTADKAARYIKDMKDALPDLVITLTLDSAVANRAWLETGRP